MNVVDFIDCVNIDLLREWAAHDLPTDHFADHIEEVLGPEAAEGLRDTNWYIWLDSDHTAYIACASYKRSPLGWRGDWSVRLSFHPRVSTSNRWLSAKEITRETLRQFFLSREHAS